MKRILLLMITCFLGFTVAAQSYVQNNKKLEDVKEFMRSQTADYYFNESFIDSSYLTLRYKKRKDGSSLDYVFLNNTCIMSAIPSSYGLRSAIVDKFNNDMRRKGVNQWVDDDRQIYVTFEDYDSYFICLFVTILP